MTLIKSISGIRGTLDGDPGDFLSTEDVTRFTSAFGQWIKSGPYPLKVVIGRDARPSGKGFSDLVCQTLTSSGIEVIDLGMTTTPTVEIAVVSENAGGGIVITASHNPIEWNALKLLNHEGEFLSEKEGNQVLDIAGKSESQTDKGEVLATVTYKGQYIQRHIEKIIALPLVDQDAIQNQRYKVAVDPVNSSGAIAIPQLLQSLGVNDVVVINDDPNGQFAHNPEPLSENLVELCKTVVQEGCDLGIAVDPDVDRLALVDETGHPFGEEYSLVAVADYILNANPGATVSNLSSTQALKYITEKLGQTYFSAAVGEVNVVSEMKRVKAVIGGEGNGGIIYPELHYGRDALVGIALFLSHLATSGKNVSKLRSAYPDFVISKNKIELTPEVDVGKILEKISEFYSGHPMSKIDGVKIEFPGNGKSELTEWVHLRKSNTEPIIRIFAESDTSEGANRLAHKVMSKIRQLAVSI